MESGENGAENSEPPGSGEPEPSALFTFSEYEGAQDIIKQDCEEMWNDLTKIQKLLREKKVEESTNGADSSLTYVYQEKERFLKSQIEVIKETKPMELPQNEVVRFEVMRDDLEKSIQDLKATLTLVQSEQKELDNEMASEELFGEELNQVKEVIQNKLEAVQAESADNNQDNSNSVLDDLENKKGKLTTLYRNLMKKMETFIQKHFPEPTEEQIKKWRAQCKRKTGDVAFDASGCESLLNIVERLMNLCIESPHDPYLAISNDKETIWPPYVELLALTGVAIVNPDDDNLIRLAPFHL